MKTLKHARLTPPMVLGARTAADLMTPNPMSIRQSATVSEAATFLAVRGISAAPVIDEAGRPVGVVSRTDILIREGQGAVYLVGSPEYCERLERPVFCKDGSRDGATQRTTVSDVMTPVVCCGMTDGWTGMPSVASVIIRVVPGQPGWRGGSRIRERQPCDVS